MFPSRNGGKCETAVRQDFSVFTRISSGDSGQHMMAKQHLLGIGSEPFAFNVFLTMAAVKPCSEATVCFSVWGIQSEQSSKFFAPFNSFFTSKARLSDAPKQSRKC
jgi:hypothetical protein